MIAMVTKECVVFKDMVAYNEAKLSGRASGSGTGRQCRVEEKAKEVRKAARPHN
jgi:hypothetical protein